MDQSPVFVGYCCCIQLRSSMKSKYPWDSNHHYDNGWKKYNHHCLPKGFNHPHLGKTIILMVVEAWFSKMFYYPYLGSFWQGESWKLKEIDD